MWWVKITIGDKQPTFLGEFGYDPQYPSSKGERMALDTKELSAVINFLSTMDTVNKIEFIRIG